MKEIESEGKTVTLAVEKGLLELGLRRDQVEVQVLEEGAAGFLGIGAKPAAVRLREKIWNAEETEAPVDHKAASKADSKPSVPSPKPRAKLYPKVQVPLPTQADEPPVDTGKACQKTEEVLRKILDLAGIEDAKVETAWDKEQSRVMARVATADGELLIGKGGRTIESLGFLVTVIVGRATGCPTAIQVETQDYWKKIEDKVIAEAESAAEEVKRTGKTYKFEPLEPSLRRLIHRRLVHHPEILTASEGEGAWRKVVIKPRQGG